MASHAKMPSSLLPVATFIISSIKKKVIMTSKINDCTAKNQNIGTYKVCQVFFHSVNIYSATAPPQLEPEPAVQP